MKKIAIIGTENSHAINFAKLINGGHEMREGRGISDFEVVGIYGEYDNISNETIVKEANVPYVAENFDEFVGKVDAVMITARHGDNHLRYAKPYLEAGIPMFVDKPITINEDDAIYLAKTAKEKNIPICGGSCCSLVTATKQQKQIVKSGLLGKLIGGSVNAPVNMKNDYGNFFFYTQHLVQIMTEVFGYDVRSCIANARDNSVSVIFKYDNFDISGFFGAAEYSVTVYGENKNSYLPIDINTDAYEREIEEFCDVVRSGIMHQTYENFIKPVFILNAINNSINEKREVFVKEFTL